MKYWDNPRNHAMSSRPATLSMIAEYLGEEGHRVLRWPASSIPVMRISEDGRGSQHEDLPYVYICDLAALRAVKNDDALRSYLLVINESQVDDWGTDIPSYVLGKTAVILSQSIDIAHVANQVGAFLIKIQELCATLALAVSSPSLSQGLINIGEDFLGCYMHVTDASHFLLGYARHHKPLDEVSLSLIKYKYHRKDVLDKQGIVLVLEDLSRDGIRTYPPDELFPMGLVSKSLRVHGQFAAYIVFQMDQSKLTPGTYDSIDLFTYYYGKMLERRMGLETRRGDPFSQNFLFHLIVDEGLSHAYIKDQCELVGFSSEGSFVLMEAQWDESFEMRIPAFAEDLGNGGGLRLSLADNGRVLVLFHGNSDEELISYVEEALSGGPLSEAEVVRLSDVYHGLAGTYYARKCLHVIEEYQHRYEEMRSAQLEEGALRPATGPKVFFFRDVFCLFWNDPSSNDFLKRYAIRHTLVARMARDDKEKGTDNLDVLINYLVNERRISTVAQNTHMHRNGVLYRIKRIQSTYRIDFEDFFARQYVLTCMQILVVMRSLHEPIHDQFPEADVVGGTLPVRPDIPRDIDYDPEDYLL